MATEVLSGEAQQVQADRAALAQLVKAAQQGDRSAQGELYHRFASFVLSSARSVVRDEHEAQEICQDVFLQVFRKLPHLRQPECFISWLSRIVGNLSLNRAKRLGWVQSADPVSLAATCGRDSSPAQVCEARERAAMVRSGLAGLSETDRQVLEAHYVRGESILEISAASQRPEGTVKRQLHFARKRLAARVRQLSGDPRSDAVAVGI